MPISDLIEQTIAQHIIAPKVLSYAGTKLNEVKGRFVSANRVYNFVLDKKGISYSPAGQGDSLLFSALYLRQDAVRKPKIGNDKCNAGKSYQCGKICLGNRRKCHKGVRDVNDARRVASILASTNEKLKGSLEGSDKAIARGKALFEARGKRVEKPKPERVKIEAKPKVRSIVDIPNIPESAKPWVKSVESLATPELVAIAQKVGFPKITTEGSKTATAFYRPLNNTISMGAHGTDNARSKITFLHEYGHYIDSNLPSNRAQTSNTLEGVAARLADEKTLKKASSKKVLPKVNLYDKGSVKKYLEASKNLLNVEVPDAFKDKNIDIEKSKQVIKDSIEKGDMMSVNDANLLSNHASYLAQFDPIFVSSPMGQVRQLDESIRSTVADLFGAITKNKVGLGHSTSYYNKGAHLQGTEAFANIIAIANSGDEKAIAVAKKFAPNMWKFVMDSIKV